MRPSVRIEPNPREIGRLLKGPEVAADIESRLQKIAAAAGPGMEVSVRVGRTRVRGSIITATMEARLAESKQRALTRAAFGQRS